MYTKPICDAVGLPVDRFRGTMIVKFPGGIEDLRSRGGRFFRREMTAANLSFASLAKSSVRRTPYRVCWPFWYRFVSQERAWLKSFDEI